MATLTASSSKRRPHEAIGRACSQSLLLGEERASKRALSAASDDDSKRRHLTASKTGLSQFLCIRASAPSGAGDVWKLNQNANAVSSPLSAGDPQFAKMLSCNSRVPTA